MNQVHNPSRHSACILGVEGIWEHTRSTTVWLRLNILYFASIYRLELAIALVRFSFSWRTSRSLNAALLFNPSSFALRAKESLPCLVFHLVEDEERRASEWLLMTEPNSFLAMPESPSPPRHCGLKHLLDMIF
jgi:hypothetical protein